MYSVEVTEVFKLNDLTVVMAGNKKKVYKKLKFKGTARHMLVTKLNENNNTSF